MAKGKFASLSYSTKSSIGDIFKACKWQFIFASIFVIVGTSVGIYFAFASLPASYADENTILGFLTGEMSSLSSFLYRLLSSLFVFFLLWLFSKNKWLCPLAMILLFYRAYLLGINVGILLRFYSLSGVIIAVIFVFPLQLFLLEFFIFFYFAVLCYDKVMFYGNIKGFIFICFCVTALLNIALTLLLLIFSPTIVFVL